MNQADEIYAANFELIKNNPIDASFVISTSGQDLNYVHNQDVASATWKVKHNLNKFGSVTVVDSANSLIYGDVQYIDMNNLEIYFSAPFTGKAYIN